MQIKTYKTCLVSVDNNIYELLDTYVPPLQEKEILVITSKIISILEGRVISQNEVPSKIELIKQEADAYLNLPGETTLTIKDKLLIPAAGIDESNGKGIYILYPKDVQKSAKEIWSYLRKRDQRKDIGVLITDSHTTPLRRGVIGVGLGWCGFEPLYNYIGKPDCYQDLLEVTQTNLVDALSASAVLCMGEGDEQTPLALIKDAPKVNFLDSPPTPEEIANFHLKMEQDLYGPLLKNAAWVFKKNSKQNG
jgi:dihydrofolate synthase / folylpolyglutamate synthase